MYYAGERREKEERLYKKKKDTRDKIYRKSNDRMKTTTDKPGLLTTIELAPREVYGL